MDYIKGMVCIVLLTSAGIGTLRAKQEEKMMNRMISKRVLLGACMTAALLASGFGEVFAQSYWSGDGAAGLSVAVLTPEGRGLEANEAYLPAMVQGVLVGDFAKFSAMKVLDRQNLDKIIAEGRAVCTRMRAALCS
ncbi:MAG: hypothetical protein LBH75_02355 [Treponema sp.]|jgi:hypothetical protein|nr:hypothetical protein [Treponema sp.]